MIFFLVLHLLFNSSVFAAEDDLDEIIFFRNSARLKEIQAEMREWDESVRGFRHEHHFALTSGSISGKWHFRRFGTARKSYQSSGVFSKFEYSFHLPIYRGLGYMLGSSVGYIFEDDVEGEIDAASALMLPGILAGLVWNITPGLRLSSGADFYLERWSNLGERDGEDENPTISVTARAVDLFLNVDLFYRLKWAIRFLAHKRQVFYLKPRNAEGYAVDAEIERQDNWIGIGILYHLM